MGWRLPHPIEEGFPKLGDQRILVIKLSHRGVHAASEHHNEDTLCRNVPRVAAE